MPGLSRLSLNNITNEFYSRRRQLEERDDPDLEPLSPVPTHTPPPMHTGWGSQPASLDPSRACTGRGGGGGLLRSLAIGGLGSRGGFYTVKRQCYEGERTQGDIPLTLDRWTSRTGLNADRQAG